VSPRIQRSTFRWIAAFGLAISAAACAARTLHLPEGPGTPVADAAGMIDEATAACRGVRTLQAELAISGRAGRDKLRGRVIAGFERPGAMRLEAVAPFGQPAFILVSRAGSATLLMPRDGRFLTDAAPAEVLEALTGVSLAPDDLLAMLAGCLTNDGTAVAARAYAGGWAAVDASDGTTSYLRREAGSWRIVAGTRGLLGIEYGDVTGASPSRVRLRVAGHDGSVTTDLTIALSQVEMNTPIDPRAFTVRPPERAVPLTLDELRRSGPLGQQR
jgi:outer membrane lipoprotein-sorting protein